MQRRVQLRGIKGLMQRRAERTGRRGNMLLLFSAFFCKVKGVNINISVPAYKKPGYASVGM